MVTTDRGQIQMHQTLLTDRGQIQMHQTPVNNRTGSGAFEYDP